MTPPIQHEISLLKALADTTRLRILRLLAAEELNVHELTRILQTPQPSISRHLAILRNSEMVTDRRDGTRVYYALSDNLEHHPVFGNYVENLGQSDHEDITRLEECLAERAATSESFAELKADQWDDLARGLQRLPAEMLMIAGMAPPGQTVADLGTGTGLLLPFLSTFADRVFAVDQSAAMLRRARKRAEQARLENVEFVKSKMEELQGKISKCDAMTLHFVLHQVPSPPAALKAIADLLKPEGRLVVVDRSPHNDESAAEKYGSIWFGFTREQLSEWTADAGLKETHWSELPDPVPTASGDSLPLFVATYSRRN
jgi:ubiquinone/menaquinone biosynthesis C-methylase UbiE